MLRMTDPEFATFVTSGIHGDKSLSDEEIQTFYFFGASVLRIFEELFRQHREGTIADDRWSSTKQTLEGIMRSPGYRATYVILKGGLDKQFAKLIDGFITACPESQALDLAAMWRNAVPGLASA